MNLFFDARLDAILFSQSQRLQQDIESQDQDYLLNANEVELIRHFVDQYRIEPLALHEDQITMTPREEMVPTHGRPTRKQIIRYHVPFVGDVQLLRCRTNSILMRHLEAEVAGNEILFDVIDWRNDTGHIKAEWEGFLRMLRSQVASSGAEVNAHNNRLESEVKEALQRRKAQLLKQCNLVASLGVPLKRATDVPSTFAIPTPKKKVVIAKPVASTAPFSPEPTLPDSAYEDILKAIQHTGIEIERHPSIYEGKDEETLRDHFLMVLSPNFQSVTGETFNKTGKTDLLIRHEGKNVFVAECGVWKGIKNFFGKIDQLLSYLTWRDSKTAVICFVRNKEFTSVLETIKKEVPSHSRFLKEEAPVAEAWLRYLFTLPDDPSRTLRLAILCFHLP